MIAVSAILFALLLGSFMLAISPRWCGWQSIASAAIFVALIAVVYGGSIEMLSRPKPLPLEWRNPGKAKVLGASIDEGKAIYVWLQIGQGAEPRAYAMPWNVHTAEQLLTAMRQGRAAGTGVEVADPFGSAAAANDSGPGSNSGNHTGQPKFYVQPQAAMPPKTNDAETAYLSPSQSQRPH